MWKLLEVRCSPSGISLVHTPGTLYYISGILASKLRPPRNFKSTSFSKTIIMDLPVENNIYKRK